MTSTNNSFWINALIQLAYELPVYLVYVVFFIIALVRWQRHPRASLLTVVGLVTLGLSAVILTFINAMIVDWVVAGGHSFQEVAAYLTTTGVARTAFVMAGLILILTAVFVSRSQPTRLARYDDPYAPLPEELTRHEASPVANSAYRKGPNP
jgi:hypothetical protein